MYVIVSRLYPVSNKISRHVAKTRDTVSLFPDHEFDHALLLFLYPSSFIEAAIADVRKEREDRGEKYG